MVDLVVKNAKVVNEIYIISITVMLLVFEVIFKEISLLIFLFDIPLI